MNDVYHLKQIEISRLILSSVNVVGCPFEVLSIKWARGLSGLNGSMNSILCSARPMFIPLLRLCQ